MWSIINKSILAITIVACIVQVVYWFGKIPDVIPSHFDGNGHVNGEMSKVAFFGLMGALNAGLLIGFPVLGAILRMFPDSMINIPNKQYWLSPSRRDETLGFTTQFLIATAWLTGWLMITCIHLSCSVAVGNRQTISPEFNWILGAYLLAILGGVIFLFLKFRVPPENNPELQTH